jgi:hypothetical protein
MAHSPATIAAPASAIQVENSDEPVIRLPYRKLPLARKRA